MRVPVLVVFAIAGVISFSACQSPGGSTPEVVAPVADATAAPDTPDDSTQPQQARRYHVRTALTHNRIRHRQPFTR